jgi:hypothetical protein
MNMPKGPSSEAPPLTISLRQVDDEPHTCGPGGVLEFAHETHASGFCPDEAP